MNSDNTEYPTARRLERGTAIRLYGATYLHGGTSRSPIVEVLGRHAHDPDPVAARSCFPHEEDARDHVRALAFEEAKRIVDLHASGPGSRAERIRLWLARNWNAWRSREVGALATEDIHADAKARLAAVSNGSFSPQVARVADWVRMPAALDLDETVHVVDLSRFPDEPIATRVDKVSKRHLVATPGHPAFDYVLRYALSETPGSFGFDAVDPASDRLLSVDDNVRAFLTAEAAERESDRVAANLRDAMRDPTNGANGADWSPCEHVASFLDADTKVMRPSGIPDVDSLSLRFMSWATPRRAGRMRSLEPRVTEAADHG